MTEPTYEYIKGQGWVPTTKPQKWAVMSKDTWMSHWANAQRPGDYFDDYNRAVARMEAGLKMNPHWSYEIWPAEREAVEGRDAW